MQFSVGPSRATSKQNDLPRTSNECAVDLVVTSDSSTRTVFSGSAMQSVQARSSSASGTSTAEAERAPSGHAMFEAYVRTV
jgi:hypothetical protein